MKESGGGGEGVQPAQIADPAEEVGGAEREGRSAVYEFLREKGRRWAGSCAERLIDERPA